MAKLHKNHVARSPYEPDKAVNKKKNPRHTRTGTRKKDQQAAAEAAAAEAETEAEATE